MKVMGSIDEALGDEVVDPVLVFEVGDKDHFGVASAHLFQGLQVADLHCCL